jgi:excinuclease ABC subunit C
MKNQDLKQINMPDKPGVYFFIKTPNKLSAKGKASLVSKKVNQVSAPSPLERAGGEVLYIGKATSLKDRVKSYFGKDLFNTRGPLLVDMVTKADSIKWQETDSVLEALILETNLIKKYQPYYNTKEKDDKSFNYVCITSEELPKVLIVRGKDLAQKKEKFSSCALPGLPGGTLGQKISPSFASMPGSLNSSVSFSSVFGPFPNGGQLKEALKIIRKIFPFLDEKSKNHYEFYKQINLVPEKKDLLLKNIKNIKLFFEGKKQKIIKDLEKEMKICAKKHEFEKAGEIKRQIFALQHINDISLIKNEDLFSNEIFRPAPFSDYRVGPSDRKISHENKSLWTHDALNYSLGNFFRIESYDIAHMSGKNMVGVMTVLENGELKKNDYRKFKIRLAEAPARIAKRGGDDTGALLEVLERRFEHAEWTYPSLIVVDGGKAQINVVKKFQEKFGLMIPIVSVLKDERHKAKNILGDKKYILKNERDILLANAEAHRFAISFHRKLRDSLSK